ncbi:MAG: cupin domain-containing protein [Bacteroidetes bacterium]|nr:cupin domain-containing protein [Bacteroidota bacterium]
MIIKKLMECKPFLAGDKTLIRELLHPGKEELEIRYSLAHAVVQPGETSTLHRLRTSEVYFILEGEGLMSIGDETSKVHPGDAIYIPPHALQCIHNPGHSDLVFLCIVDPAWRMEDEEIL